MKAREQAEMEKMEELRKVIEASPLTKQIKMEKATEILAKRKEAKERIAILEAKGKALPSIDEAVSEFTAELHILEKRQKILEEEINKKWAGLRSEKFQIENEKQQLEGTLLDTYDPRLDEEIQFFRNKLDFFRSSGRISSDYLKGDRNLFTDTVTITAESNADAVRGGILYCQATIKELEKMKLEPELDLQKIEAIKAGIPDIGVYTESTGKKPLPGSKGINPRWLLKSDSQLDWTIGKLTEKFKKLMRK